MRDVAKDKPASAGGNVHCVVCINRGNFKPPEYVSVVNGYATCPDHMNLVSQPGFDVFKLLHTERGQAL